MKNAMKTQRRSPYSGAAFKIKKEEAPEKEDVPKAHGSPAKKRSDGFQRGGSVYSLAAKGLCGKKGFAGKLENDGNHEHDEMLDRRAHSGGTEGATHRAGHSGKAQFQYASGGAVSRKGYRE
jgi:hypothetical protein